MNFMKHLKYLQTLCTILVKGDTNMIAYISKADESTGYLYNIQLVDNGVYVIGMNKYTNDLQDAFEYAESLDCNQIYTTF